MNCLSENEGEKTEKKNGKNTLVFTNELPNWKGKKKTEKTTLVFTNELPDWKRILKGKKTEKKWEKQVGVLYYGGGLLIFPGS